MGMHVICHSNFNSFLVTIPVFAFDTTMASMLQCPLVASLRNRASTNSEDVLTELKSFLSVSCAKFKTLSEGQRHRLRELHYDLELEPRDGAGPVTRSKKRQATGITHLESVLHPVLARTSSVAPCGDTQEELGPVPGLDPESEDYYCGPVFHYHRAPPPPATIAASSAPSIPPPSLVTQT